MRACINFGSMFEIGVNTFLCLISITYEDGKAAPSYCYLLSDAEGNTALTFTAFGLFTGQHRTAKYNKVDLFSNVLGFINGREQVECLQLIQLHVKC